MTTARSVKKFGGVPRGALPWWILQSKPRRFLVVLPQEEDVLSFVDDTRALFRLPGEWAPPEAFRIDGFTVDDEPFRQVARHGWSFGKTKGLVASREGLDVPVDPLKNLEDKTFFLKPGLTMKRHDFEDLLGEARYSRNDRPEQEGEYSIRGDVVDVWPPGQAGPLRLTWNFDDLEAIRNVDVYTQRSQGFLTELFLYPVLSGEGATLIDDLTEDTTVFVFDDGALDEEFLRKFAPAEVIVAGPGETAEGSEGFEPAPLFNGHIESLRDTLKKWHDDDWRVAIFCHNEGERDRLDELLEERLLAAKGLKAPWCPPLLIGELEHGFTHPGFRQAVVANSEIFGRYRKRIRLPKFDAGQALRSPLDIRPQDFLVHEKHGIGRFSGLQFLTVGKVTSEYLTLEYKGGDKLYVPIFELQQVQKYLGAEGRRPALSSLDTPSWERLKTKVKEDVAKLASELLEKAAKRNIRPGVAFPGQTHLEKEFADSFLYELTPDQKKTLEDVEADMVAAKAMDRLVCGDVGYGKTEIAMRAALKAGLAGRQVAVLCPTTILAEQHFRNFSERLADYPLTLGLISRFQDAPEKKRVLEGAQKGSIDIVIGTHRLLSKDVSFRNLGLVIIDEEHRFGVRQKQKLLDLRETVDVLSLTATPIPRTLAASVGGIKDLSIIETPPQGRLPIVTHVGLFDEDIMVKAVHEELDRGGQVFYVHNRVKTLLSRKEWLKSLLPHLRIAMVHGQMKEGELEKAMHDFLQKKVDVLLATTIIESGLDIPTVNTLIVEEAEEMGLAQLYQLRGRVGRSSRRAYCYLFYSSRNMTTDARKRLEALKEFTSLGSGFRLAMRDMEIRGAGNLLGPQQHGNMAAVGLETFGKLLNEEIHRIKGEEIDDETSGPVLEISLSSFIPDDYVPAESERVQMYKRIINARSNELVKIKEELIDRCGPLPAPVKTLFDAAAMRLLLKGIKVEEVHQENDGLVVLFKPEAVISDKAFNLIVNEKKELYQPIPGNRPGVRIKLTEKDNPLDFLGDFVRLIQS